MGGKDNVTRRHVRAQYDVEGLVILVAGGTTGLGLSAARALVANGARVAVFSRSTANVSNALNLLGDAAVGLAADAATGSAATDAVDLAVKRWGRLDGLYHVAGGSGRSKGDGALHDLSDDGLDYTLDLNLKSVLLSNRAVLRHLLAQGDGGVILNMSSVLGWSPEPRFFASHAYAAAKAGVIGVSKAAAAFYAKDNIRINVIAPALVETPMSKRACGDEAIVEFVAHKQPLDSGRVGVPEDLDGAACFLLSRSARYMTGQVIAVDGGWTVS